MIDKEAHSMHMMLYKRIRDVEQELEELKRRFEMVLEAYESGWS